MNGGELSHREKLSALTTPSLGGENDNAGLPFLVGGGSFLREMEFASKA